VPETIRITFHGWLPEMVSAKDLILTIIGKVGADGADYCSVEFWGDVGSLTIDDRFTIANMGVEMGAKNAVFPADEVTKGYLQEIGVKRISWNPEWADPGANYRQELTWDLAEIVPAIAVPHKVSNYRPVTEIAGMEVQQCLIGTCTNGRMDDLRAAAAVLKSRKVAPGVVLKIVPATDAIWHEAMHGGIIEIFKHAGALVGNAGCAGCAAGQIGQNGPGEVTVSTGNRNFTGKQGKGDVYLASPETAAASAIAGAIVNPGAIPARPALFKPKPMTKAVHEHCVPPEAPLVVEGRIWLIPRDNVDTDMIFHNRHLTITDIREMGQHAFGNLPGWEHFSKNAQPGDIVVTGKNFGAGSSRQQAVDCFKSLRIGLLIARSFGAIYFRNAVNAGFPVMSADLLESGLKDGDHLRVNLATGEIEIQETGVKVQGRPFPPVQLEIYRRGGLLG
jgi:3-isopropylmalate/(R)-2-methylmalate dehydratase large subunit